jgi:hypothetical protein
VRVTLTGGSILEDAPARDEIVGQVAAAGDGTQVPDRTWRWETPQPAAL